MLRGGGTQSPNSFRHSLHEPPLEGEQDQHHPGKEHRVLEALPREAQTPAVAGEQDSAWQYVRFERTEDAPPFLAWQPQTV